MKKLNLDWTLGYAKTAEAQPEEWFHAHVPGAAQHDYALAHNWPDHNYGVNFRDYAWMEDVYWTYRAYLNFTLEGNETATMVFQGVDYEYDVLIDGTPVYSYEGMFAPAYIDVSKYTGGAHELTVRIHPIPKATDTVDRSQARLSAKPAACYEWDWHPRLASVGIWDEAYLMIQNRCSVRHAEVSYELSEAMDRAEIHVETQRNSDCAVRISLLDGKHIVASAESTDGTAVLTLENPKLWYPVGYGKQPLYTVRVEALDEIGSVRSVYERRIGLRRVKLVMNEGAWDEPAAMPKSRSDAPATLMINGQKIFAKGSNWVNAHIFPGLMDDKLYTDLLTLVRDANMNILRIWGGGFANKEKFFELCDEMGIMVWQEFPLACNEYPDDKHYLSVLEAEARAIVRRLRSHPSLVLWCGGNELFNSWSGMTDQHHALRLLDKVCYEEDRYTPFNMTSPMVGMAHGHYIVWDHNDDIEAITLLNGARNTAYTEFGSPGAADIDYIKQYISEEDYADFNADNPVWRGHHAFGAWIRDSWVRVAEAEHFFGGYKNVDDLLKKTQFLQAMGYKSLFEEMRRQWPHCSMALNWCFNEPWPTFANNSLISFPAIPKKSYYAVKDALRPRLASLKIEQHLQWAGDVFRAGVWLLNDTVEALEAQKVRITYTIGEGEEVFFGTLNALPVPAQGNLEIGAVAFPIPRDFIGMIHVHLYVEGHPEMDSHYSYPCKNRLVKGPEGTLNM